MIVLDTNTILRCILRDNKEMGALIDDQMAQEECLIFPEVIAEIIYVLLKVYRLDRGKIEILVSAILRHKNVRFPHRAVVKTALRYFGSTKLDFVDCLLIGYAIAEGRRIFTFDKKLKKYLP